MSASKKIKTDHPKLENGTNRHKIIVGIDYGTTYSGVSYVTTEKKNIEDITIVNQWPGLQARSCKTPTRIAYSRENPNLVQNKWGFDVEPRHVSYSQTKLLLDKSASVGDFDSRILEKSMEDGEMRLPKFRNAQGVCEDFLREVYVYVSEKLKRQMGENTFDLTAMECWITLPAIWSEEAKNATLHAAKNAGFGSRTDDEVYTIAEPEAAAIATLKRYSEPGCVNSLTIGENVLICDCGGGTVDITTYTITQLKPELGFDELCVGVGGKCGSTFIDRNLHCLLSERFGAAFDSLKPSQKGPGSLFMKCFENVKQSFGLSEDTGIREIYPINMAVEDSEYFDEDESSVKLSYADMQQIFDPVVEGVIKLVTQQVAEAKEKKGATINRMILVGGFGESAYLNQRLTRWCSEIRGIQLLCPENPQGAVVQGAALRGLNDLAPKVKQARRHYGYSIGRRFRRGIDLENHAFYSSTTGKKTCSGRMHWLIGKGEQIFKDMYRPYTFNSTHTVGKSHKIGVKLYSFGADHAADRFDDVGVESVGIIVCELPETFFYGNALKKSYNRRKKKMVDYINVEVRVIFGTKGSNLMFSVAVNDKIVGSATIEYTTS